MSEPPRSTDILTAARYFNVLGQPLRIRILLALDEKESDSVGLAKALGVAKPNTLRKQLEILSDAFAVRHLAEGTTRVYSLTEVGRVLAHASRLVACPRSQAGCPAPGSEGT